ncbi:MAG TPA: T9SS type A sorting domain-containing protein [Bacteroidia bacterium]|nr:T9SS type A sorting domain-containing protein [Bacteroidia bacterium]
MKNSIYILLFSLMCCTGLKAQVNLVPNPGFEDTLQCNHVVNDFQGFVDKWWGLNVQYFNGYCNGPGAVGMPYNEWGFQWQMDSGLAYAGLCSIYLDSFAYTKNLRDYIWVPLKDSLKAGKTYFVSFWVNLANNSMYACNDIGAKFTTQIPLLDHTLLSGPQIQNNPTLNPLTDTAFWTCVKGRFIASGGEKYIILGNFMSDSLSHIQYMHATPNLTYDWRESFYYIDNVFVGLDSNTVMGITENNTVSVSVRLFPNPNNGNMQVNYELGTHERTVLDLYDVCGKLLRSYALDPNRAELSISEGDLNQGLYFYKVHTSASLLASGKFAIVK